MLSPRHFRLNRRAALVAGMCAAVSSTYGYELANVSNPIGRLARVFDSQLVKTEDRVAWLENKVSSLSEHEEHLLKSGVGYRGGRLHPNDADPFVVIDLGREYPIETLYLVPSQRENAQDPGIFPKRFTLELSNQADFGQREVIFTTGSSVQTVLDSTPVPINARARGRYVRLTVQEGQMQEVSDVFGLSELVVISKGEPVSLGADVSCGGELDLPGIWFPSALTDGRTPLGIWQNAKKPLGEAGDSVNVTDSHDTASWTFDAPSPAPVDRVVLFPFQPVQGLDKVILPDGVLIQALGDNGAELSRIEWTNPVAGNSLVAPLTLPLHGIAAKSIRVTGTTPFAMGSMKMHAFSEIEIWSQGKNIAKDLPFQRTHGNETQQVLALSDGFTSEKQIMPMGIWLQQLHDRGMIERELSMLRPVHRQLASESELNATWGSAVILGLTFLIPVFIVERRRLMSRDQIDNLRKRIASDLHDDIGSNLGSISLIARTARKDLVRLHGPEEVAEDLGEVESIARESSLAMRDIVWLLERRQDSIGDLVQRMRETAGRLLREINYTLECESTKTTSKLSLDAKRHLFLFYKEAIHNVIKHSQANNVLIRLWDEGDELALEILDNGVGLPMNKQKQPSSVQKLEDRARVLAGALRIESTTGSGTHIRLFVKRSLLNSNPNFA